jgi:hypothetical protein
VRARLVTILLTLSIALAAATGATAAGPSTARISTAAQHTITHLHAVHRYQTGQPVRNLEWLLAGHKPSIFKLVSWRHPISGVYDQRVVDAVANMKYRLGFPKTQLGGGVAGARLIEILKGERKRPFAWKLRTGNRVSATVTGAVIQAPKVRTLVADANYLIAHASLVRYSQTRRMDIVRLHLRLPPLNRVIFEDCSSSTTGLYWLADLPDPNGRGYDGYGYTGTQSAHGRIVWRLGQPLSLLRPGDLIFYGGGWPHHHVTMYLGNGRVFSHGTDTGPFNLPVLYRSDAVSAHRYFG